MATETDLRDALRGPEPEGRGEIDLDAVLRRTRRRRRPRVIAAQALGSVALIGVLGTAIVVAIPRPDQGAMMTADDAAGSSEAAPLADDSSLGWMPDACGAPVSDPTGSDLLTLDISVEQAAQPDVRTPVTLTLRNDGPDRIVGSTTAAPYLSLALDDGTIVWHSAATQDASARRVDLQPGESMTFETSFERVVCRTEDDLEMDDPAHPLPLAAPGDYELRSVIIVALEGGPSIVARASALPIEIR